MSEDRTLHGSPYVEQIEKYAHSLKQLSSTFLGLEEKKRRRLYGLGNAGGGRFGGKEKSIFQ